MFSMETSKKTTSGIVYNGACFMGDVVAGKDGVNDPIVTVYDGIDNTGIELVPTATLDASALGWDGIVYKYARDCKTGIYVEITCAGAVEAVVGFRPRALMGVS